MSIELSQPGLLLIRHAPSEPQGRLHGRVDVPARIDGEAGIPTLRELLGGVERRVSSPARRCRETAAAIWPDGPAAEVDARLWEQDFGEWDGKAFSEIPDLGPLPPETLAAHRPPGGESFDDLVRRTAPAIRSIAEQDPDAPVAVIAHAGTIRAALAMALGANGPALGFEVAALSVTRLRLLPSGDFTIDCTNWRPA
ncbi:histidine phosphatase family protein [Dichotomicrobium thermohalophilum]|uniref:Alpha-ribazole phosphatase n=1 Tax=Dichotomicrobium thermohalophilum TaxID=933063 RepID=A0A397PE20_9HYPH|nr:histidine phosphatase family protein [Dichotomicrobium thermohalophilum]RIA45465.1 alpha-ribazole phosphatase [Dichotomicrobium thermohalophilum]